MLVNNKSFVRITIILLFAFIAYAFAPAMSPAYAAPGGRAGKVSVDHACSILEAAAKRYNKGARIEEIAEGIQDAADSGENRRPITRAEAIAMISRAFGELPAPVGDWHRVCAPEPDCPDAPEWRRDDFDNLARARVLLPAPDGLLRGDEEIGAAEFDAIIRRIYALLAAAPQDDFYRAVNKDWLNRSKLPAGKSANGTFDELERRVERQTDEILDSIVKSAWPKGSPEQKISDFYRCIVNVTGRNNAGANPVKPYLMKIGDAKDLASLNEALYAISRDLGVDVFFGFRLEPDILDNARYAAYFAYPEPLLPIDAAFASDPPQTEALSEYAQTLFALTGDKNPAESAGMAIEMELLLAQARRSPASAVYYAKDYRKIGIIWYEALFPSVDFGKLLSLSELSPEAAYYAADKPLIQAFAAAYTDDNLETLKAYAAFRLLGAFSDILSEGFAVAETKLGNALTGAHASPDFERAARDKVCELMGAYVGEKYAEKYFTTEAKKDVGEMVRTFVNLYKKRLDNLEWMSAPAKTAAKHKLDAIEVKIGIPDSPDCVMDSVYIRGPAEGGSYFENMIGYYKRLRSLNASNQGAAVDKSLWDSRALTINAFYDVCANEITLPACVLQPPFYKYGGEREANLGGIGCVIAHELTHAFDYHGSQFNAYGKAADWWSEQDRERFSELCESVAAHYGGYECAPGVPVDGELTLMENIADLGMIACALDAVEMQKNPDYELFFTSAAKIWAGTSTREALIISVKTDMHSPGCARVNKTFQNFSQFHDAFSIKPSDGMYLAPEKRINVW